MRVLRGWLAHQALTADSWNLGACWALVGYAALGLGDVEQLAAATAETVRLAPDLDDGWMSSQFAANNGRLAQVEGRFDDAVIHFTRAAEFAGAVGLPATEGFHLVSVGLAQQQAGHGAAAITTYERAIDLTTSVGLMRLVSSARVRLGQLRLLAGDRDDARTLLEAADSWYRSSGGGAEAGLARELLASLNGSSP